MCNFFSFISDGNGKVHYINAEKRKRGFENPDSHTHIAKDWLGYSTADDKVNKYEYTKGKFIVDQINVCDDSVYVNLWLDEFKLSDEFTNICIETVKYNTSSITTIPDNIALNIYKDALQRDNYPIQLQSIPSHLRTLEICKIALTSGDLSSLTYAFVPDHLKTLELCKIAVESNGYGLRYMPDNLITYDLCKLAVESSSYALEYVPDDLKTAELCKIAVDSDCYALEYVPERLKTLEICEIAVKDDDELLRYVPEHLKNEIT